jgi:succinyl-CoA synthetase beta subunit
VNAILLAEKFVISRERYFAILMDRASGGPILIGSKVGGTSIEDIAAADPSAIIKMPVDIIDGLSLKQAEEMAVKMDFQGEQIAKAADCIKGLYQTFTDCDCTMVEINPLAELDDGRVMVCDAKVNFDDNASYRQKEIFDQRDETQEDAREVAAKKWDLNYIGLDGNVACMVNGAGLAMSTMDLLSLYGGSPANFLDVGGSAQEEQIVAAFEILNNDPNVKSILVNIFGGIMRCDVIASGVVNASKKLGLEKPLVIRLVGTNVEIGEKIIADSGLNLYPINDLDAAAKKAVELAR